MSRVQPEIADQPWVAPTPVAEVLLDCPGWPDGGGARMLRGAICAALGEDAHVDWHGHAPDASTMSRFPRVIYRTHAERPSVWLWGQLAHEHATELVRRVHSLRLAAGQVVPVEGHQVRTAVCDVRAVRKRWVRYELATPLFPPDVAWARRPRKAGPERWAWAGQLLRRSIEQWMVEAGLSGEHLDLHVHLGDMIEERVEWRREERGLAVRRRGWRGRFVVNAELPDGVGVGRHRSEGWGEVRRCR